MADVTFRLPEVGMGPIAGARGHGQHPAPHSRWRTLSVALCGNALDASANRLARLTGWPGGLWARRRLGVRARH